MKTSSIQPGRGFRAVATYILLLIAALVCLPAHAVSLQEVTRALERETRVYDFAGVLSLQDKRVLQERLERMEDSRLAEGVVVVLDRLEGGTAQDYALRIGQAWKVGGKDSQNGFVLVVSIADRKRFLATGIGLQAQLPDSAAGEIMRKELVPQFQQGLYGPGLIRTVSAIEERLRATGGAEAQYSGSSKPRTDPVSGLFTFLLAAATVVATFRAWPRGTVPGADRSRGLAIALGFGSLGAALFAASQNPGGGTPLVIFSLLPAALAGLRFFEGAWMPVRLDEAGTLRGRVLGIFWVGFAAGALVLLFGLGSSWAFGWLLVGIPAGVALSGYLNRIPRRCPECGGALRWLPEAEEAQFLRAEENAEQQLGSVDYDVWRCNHCNRSAVFGKRQAAARYGECPKCRRQTLSRRSVVDEPTGWGTGGFISEITECRNPGCGYQDVQRRPVPRGWQRGYDGDSGPGIIIVPPVFGGGWGGHSGGHHGDVSGGDSGGGFDFGGIDVGGFGGGGDFDGGGAGGDW